MRQIQYFDCDDVRVDSKFRNSSAKIRPQQDVTEEVFAQNIMVRSACTLPGSVLYFNRIQDLVIKHW